jgi:hypothetical protein
LPHLVYEKIRIQNSGKYVRLKAEESLDVQNCGRRTNLCSGRLSAPESPRLCVDGQSQETLLAYFGNSLCLLAIF